MILEHVLLPVKPGREAEFETAFAGARGIISATPGFRGLTLSRCVERPGVYLLLVQWDRLEDHTEGFRGSPRYERWRELLHHFYDPFPVVEHFQEVLAADPADPDQPLVAPSEPGEARRGCGSAPSGT